MISVVHPAAPAKYLQQVKERGQNFLVLHPSPSGKEWKRNAYWQEIHSDLYNAHSGICSYCASWTPRKRNPPQMTESTSIDHFIPKSIDPAQAYEWSNFRLCRSRLNHRKDNFTDVLDPHIVSNDWFVIDFTDFLINPAAGLISSIENQVEQTISRLGLNTDNDYVAERIAIIREYSINRITISQLEQKYPFIARQIRNQDFDNIYKQRFAQYFILQRV